jgi:hypothetical protein
MDIGNFLLSLTSQEHLYDSEPRARETSVELLINDHIVMSQTLVPCQPSGREGVVPLSVCILACVDIQRLTSYIRLET